jgi:nucleoside-diphosphate-sugar epimerase
MANKVALVAGASGVAGRGIVAALASLEGWEVIALGRNPPEEGGRSRFLAVDLLDPGDCREKLGALTGVTHIFFAAYQEQPTEAAQVAVNGAMLRNLVEAVEAAAPALAHVSLMEGTKAYGCHFGPFKTPAKETDPHHIPPNFYYDQEDFLRRRQLGKSWTWSALRPDLICGPGVGHPMNLLMAIAVYASVCRELGLPLHFPGTRDAYRALFEATDAALLGRAAVWAATDPRCGNEVFNITNGDYFRWEHLWPCIAACFGLEPGPPLATPLTQMMADKGPLWDGMVKAYGLRHYPYEKLVSWAFGEFVFRIGYDVLSDTTKARRFGFHEVADTEEMFARMFRELREQRYIP